MPSIPFALQWTISESELKDSKEERIFSENVTNIPEFEYYLSIRSNGPNNEYHGKTWIFMQLNFENIKKVDVDYTIIIESANVSVTCNEIFEKSIGRGCFGFDTTELFDPEKKYIVDGELIVKVNGIFKYEIENAAISAGIVEQKWEGGELGDESWDDDDTKDFAILVDGKEIKVHKLILVIRSEVFKAMLNTNMKEAAENKVEIKDFPFNVVETCIKLIYHCTFTTTLTMDELMLLLQFFDKYNLSVLKAKVEPYLIALISHSTVVRLTNASILTNSFRLKEKCIVFLSSVFASKTPLSDFMYLDRDIVMEILQNSFYRIVKTEK